MNCPACQNSLEKETHENTELDVCHKCGGVFFDNFELDKFDNLDEPSGSLLEISSEANFVTDDSLPRNCPKCIKIVMQKHFFGPKREVTIDECAGCGSVWLDQGELNSIRNNYQTVEDKKKAVEQLYNEEFSSHISELRKQYAAEREGQLKIAKALNFLLPWKYLK